MNLSNRGKAAAMRPVRVDMGAYFEALNNRYHKKDNPDGAFPINVAENNLCWSLLRDKIAEVNKRKLPEWVSGYGNPLGTDSFRESVAAYLSEFLFGIKISGQFLAFSSGLTSVIELTAFVLGEAGDVAVIPAPAYPVYTGDLGVKSEMKRYDLIPTGEFVSGGSIPLQIADLERARLEITETGDRFRMLILTTPDNPTGGIYTREQLDQIADWCIANQVHLVVNEIYGLSRFDIHHPELKADYPEPVIFESFGRIMAERKHPLLHLWYSFSKDLGISGFRVGLVHSYNEDFLKAYGNINMTHSVSNYTQWTLQCVLEDRTFIRSYLKQSRQALTHAYLIVIKSLRSIGVKYYPSYGSLFAWIDLSELLMEDSESGEHQLWENLFYETGILLTPASGFGHNYRGHYRMVISFLSHSELQVAMDRLKDWVVKKRVILELKA